MKIYHIYTYSLQETLSGKTCALPKGQPSSPTLIIKILKNSAVTYSMQVKTKQNPNESCNCSMTTPSKLNYKLLRLTQVTLTACPHPRLSARDNTDHKFKKI